MFLASSLAFRLQTQPIKKEASPATVVVVLQIRAQRGTQIHSNFKLISLQTGWLDQREGLSSRQEDKPAKETPGLDLWWNLRKTSGTWKPSWLPGQCWNKFFPWLSADAVIHLPIWREFSFLWEVALTSLRDKWLSAVPEAMGTGPW